MGQRTLRPPSPNTHVSVQCHCAIAISHSIRYDCFWVIPCSSQSQRLIETERRHSNRPNTHRSVEYTGSQWQCVELVSLDGNARHDFVPFLGGRTGRINLTQKHNRTHTWTFSLADAAHETLQAWTCLSFLPNFGSLVCSQNERMLKIFSVSADAAVLFLLLLVAKRSTGSAKAAQYTHHTSPLLHRHCST